MRCTTTCSCSSPSRLEPDACAAIDWKHDAVDERSRWRAEVRGTPADVFGLSESLLRGAREDLLLAGGIARERLVQHGSFDLARRDGVDADVARAQFAGQ